jgi:hypothetical protein
MGLWLLLVFAVIGTVYILNNPLVYMTKTFEGMKVGEVYEKLERGGVSGCLILLTILLLTVLYTFVIEPGIALFALLNNVGPRPLALAVLAVALVNLVGWVKILFVDARNNIKSEEEFQTTVLTGAKKNGWRNRLRYMIASLPIFYMWFVWLVLAGIIEF